MASLSDEKLWEYINKCDVSQLKSLLAKVGVPHQVRKEFLQKRLFYSVRLGLDILPTTEQQDQQVAALHREKLDLGNGLMLPHPVTIEEWDESSISFPPVTKQDIQNYFTECEYQKYTGYNCKMSEF